MQPYISAADVVFRYPPPPGGEPVLALDGAGLRVARGEFLALVGPNGSGKSTLARMCNVLLRPEAGSVVVDGLDTADPAHLWPIRDRVGMVFQNPDNQIVAAMVEEDVAFGPENQALPPAEIRARVEGALAAVGLTGLRLRPPHLLSGGQKQRLAIAGALALRPACLVLDEPTAMLDPRGRREVITTVRQLNRDLGIAVIWITHFMSVAAAADRVVVMAAGRAVLDGTPATVFAQVDRIRALQLDVPPAVSMADSLRQAGIPLPENILDLAHLVTCLDDLRHRSDPSPSPPPGSNVAPPLPAQETALGRDPDAPLTPPGSERTVAIQVENLTHTYAPGSPHEWTAIAGVSLTIHQGDCWGIIGATGSGKSTLVQHFNALLKPTAGRVVVYGHDLSDRKADMMAVRRRVGLAFQYPEHQLFAATVRDEIAYGPRNLGLDEAAITRQVQWALDAVGLPAALLDRSPFSLSGGQARRVALAGVLAMRPDTLILDEPGAGLDPAGRREILRLVADLHRAGLTIVLVSHSMEDVAESADHVLVLDRGRVAMEGTPRTLFRRGAELESLQLAAPAAAVLVDRLREAGWPGAGRAVTEAEAVAEICGALHPVAGGSAHA